MSACFKFSLLIFAFTGSSLEVPLLLKFLRPLAIKIEVQIKLKFMGLCVWVEEKWITTT
jgi:hypothetical protein